MKKTALKTEQKEIAVAMAEEVELARDYVQMLLNNEIPARLAVNNDTNGKMQVLILVPEEFVEQSQKMIKERSSDSDFYESIFDYDLKTSIEEMEQ